MRGAPVDQHGAAVPLVADGESGECAEWRKQVSNFAPVPSFVRAVGGR